MPPEVTKDTAAWSKGVPINDMPLNAAICDPAPNADPAAPWSWTFWQAILDLPCGPHELIVRAWDSAGQTQPAKPTDVWNFKGYLCAAWHRVPVQVGPR